MTAPSPWHTSFRATAIAVAVSALVALAGCATTERVVSQVETRTVEVPPSLLRCMPEPQAKAATSLCS